MGSDEITGARPTPTPDPLEAAAHRAVLAAPQGDALGVLRQRLFEQVRPLLDLNTERLTDEDSDEMVTAALARALTDAPREAPAPLDVCPTFGTPAYQHCQCPVCKPEHCQCPVCKPGPRWAAPAGQEVRERDENLRESARYAEALLRAIAHQDADAVHDWARRSGISLEPGADGAWSRLWRLAGIAGRDLSAALASTPAGKGGTIYLAECPECGASYQLPGRHICDTPAGQAEPKDDYVIGVGIGEGFEAEAPAPEPRERDGWRMLYDHLKWDGTRAEAMALYDALRPEAPGERERLKAALRHMVSEILGQLPSIPFPTNVYWGQVASVGLEALGLPTRYDLAVSALRPEATTSEGGT